MSAPEGGQHLLALGPEWSLWRWVCLRSAGFPVERALALASPAAAAAADRVLNCELECARVQEELAVQLERRPENEPAEARKARVRALRAVRGGRLPEGADPLVFAELESKLTARKLAHERLTQGWSELTERARAELRELARAPDFRCAISWQNRRALATGIASLLRQDAEASDFKTRQNEALVANYAQRYCLKNDSIGFFGPVTWGEFCERSPALRLETGDELIGRRETFFEYWGIERLAQRFSESRDLRCHLAPRLVPSMRLVGETLHYPIARQRQLGAAVASLLAACDGQTAAQQIAAELLALRRPEFSCEEEILDALEQLAQRGILIWQLEIPPADTHPERLLRAALEGLPDSGARRGAIQALERLELHRSRIHEAGTDAALGSALVELDATFTELTGTAATRAQGETYAARSLIYQECRRNLELQLGPELQRRLAAPLGLVLASARWFTFEIARRYCALFERSYAALAAELGSERVDLLAFLARAELSDSQSAATPIVAEVAAELASGWAEILQLDVSARRVTFSSAALHERVSERFAAPHPGWPSARFHSPDVLVAAHGPAQFARGDFSLVLGELHAGWNTLSAPVFLHQHHDPDVLRRAFEDDLPRPRVAQVEPKDGATRLFLSLRGARELDFELGSTRSRLPRNRVLAAADLVVERVAEQLLVRTRDGRSSFEIVEFMEGYLLYASMAHFRLLPRAAHLPRVSFDDVVVARESWRIMPDLLEFAQAATPAERFLGARRLCQQLGLPRHAFVKIPEEPKPCYVDFDSPSFVDCFARLARKASQVALTEMLPAPEETWLVDAEGRTYTSELRMVARDTVAYPLDPNESRGYRSSH